MMLLLIVLDNSWVTTPSDVYWIWLLGCLWDIVLLRATVLEYLEIIIRVVDIFSRVYIDLISDWW